VPSRVVGDQVAPGSGVTPLTGHAHVDVTRDVGPNLAHQLVGMMRGTGAADPRVRGVWDASSASTSKFV
jgi:hypothetical protein